MKPANPVERKKRREILTAQTWSNIEKQATEKIPINKIKHWYDLELSRLYRYDYPSQFVTLERKILTKCKRYLYNRELFEKMHEDLLIEIDLDSEKIKERNKKEEEEIKKFLSGDTEYDSIYKSQKEIRELRNQLKEERAKHKDTVAEIRKKIIDLQVKTT